MFSITADDKGNCHVLSPDGDIVPYVRSVQIDISAGQPLMAQAQLFLHKVEIETHNMKLYTELDGHTYELIKTGV